MSRQELKAVLTIGGRVDNTFGRLGDALIGLGYEVDKISDKLINFGKDALIEYAAYDDLMRETKAVGEFTAAEIAALDKLNSELIKNGKIYTNQQLAEAEVIMGQYGMTINAIKDMLPDALNLAMAGNIDMANSVDYLYSSLESLGLEVSYADELVDQMVKTAAIGATDIDTLGESLQRLGSGAQMFMGGSAEILSILTAMSKFGADQRGSQGGTWLRNFMLSLAAPTSSVTDMVDALEQLGASQEEIEEYASDHSDGLAAMAIQSLEAAGLRIYDEQGKLLPAIDIIKSLRDAVYGNSGYALDFAELTGELASAGGDIESFMASTAGMTDNALYTTLAKIFGKRGITTALNLISITDEEWAQITGDIMNAEGFADATAATMQGGLGGAQRRLNAISSEVKKVVGGALEDEAVEWTETLTSFMVNLADMDEDKVEVLTAGLTGIAVAGPGLLIAGGAARLLGMLATPGGAIALLAAGAVAAGFALHELAEINFKKNFGTMSLDIEELRPYIQSLDDDFESAYAEARAFGEVVLTAAGNYDTAAQTFAKDLLTSTITGKTLSETEQQALLDLGGSMVDQVRLGVENRAAETLLSLETLYGGEGVAGVGDDPSSGAYRQIVSLLDNYYSGLREKAYAIGENLRNEMTLAFEDGVMDGTEYRRIMAHYNEMNAIISEVEDFNRRAELEAGRMRASAVTEETFAGYMAENEAAMQAFLDDREAAYFEGAGKIRAAANMGLEWAGIDPETGAVVDPVRNQRVLQGLDPVTGKAWTSEERQTYAENGWIDPTTGRVIDFDRAQFLLSDYTGKFNAETAEGRRLYEENAARAMDAMLAGTSFGPAWDFMNMVLANSDTMHRDQDTGLLTLQDVDWTALDKAGISVTPEDLEHLEQNQAYFEKMLAPYADNPQVAGWLDNLEYVNMLAWDLRSYQGRKKGYEESGGTLDMYNEFSTPEERELRKQIAAAQTELDTLLAEQAQIETDIAQTQGRLDGKDRPWHYYLTNGYQTDWMALYGNVLGGNLTERQKQIGIDIESAQRELATLQAELDSSPVYVTLKVRTSGTETLLDEYAEGGRATQASIFGEAGAEWAIPEAHTQRTAELLNSARRASGFTWPELISRVGGMNANPQHEPTKLVYAPVIYANDARGVEQKLAEDKERFVKWMKEFRAEEAMASYG